MPQEGRGVGWQALPQSGRCLQGEGLGVGWQELPAPASEHCPADHGPAVTVLSLGNCGAGLNWAGPAISGRTGPGVPILSRL